MYNQKQKRQQSFVAASPRRDEWTTVPIVRVAPRHLLQSFADCPRASACDRALARRQALPRMPMPGSYRRLAFGPRVRSRDYPIDVPASFFCPRSFDRAVIITVVCDSDRVGLGECLSIFLPKSHRRRPDRSQPVSDSTHWHATGKLGAADAGPRDAVGVERESRLTP